MYMADKHFFFKLLRWNVYLSNVGHYALLQNKVIWKGFFGIDAKID